MTMGQELNVPEADRCDEISDEEAYVEAAFGQSYGISNFASYMTNMKCCGPQASTWTCGALPRRMGMKKIRSRTYTSH